MTSRYGDYALLKYAWVSSVSKSNRKYKMEKYEQDKKNTKKEMKDKYVFISSAIRGCRRCGGSQQYIPGVD
jgi:hypothetical protein